MAGVGTGLNENKDSDNERSGYFVGVLRVLRQGEMGKTKLGSSWKRDTVLFSGLGSVLKLSFQREGFLSRKNEDRRYMKAYT